jgi:hypothetical protein
VSSASERIAAPDALETDGAHLDPYAQHSWLNQPYGVAQTGKLGHVPERDAEIDRVAGQLRDPWKSPEDELADANRNPYPWERDRAQLRRRYSIDALLHALEVLRDRDPGLCSMVHSVFVYQQPVELNATVEALLEGALRLLSDLMPAEIKAPGDPKPPAQRRWEKRHAA